MTRLQSVAVRKFSLQYFYCSSLQDYDSQILEYCVLMFTLMISVCITFHALMYGVLVLTPHIAFPGRARSIYVDC